MNRGAWQATVHGGYKELNVTEHTHTHTPTLIRTHTHTHTQIHLLPGKGLCLKWYNLAQNNRVCNSMCRKFFEKEKQ